MAAHKSIELLELVWTNATGANASPSSVELSENSEEYSLTVVSTSTSAGDATIALTVEHSPDNVNWFSVPDTSITVLDSSSFADQSVPLMRGLGLDARIYRYLRVSNGAATGSSGGATTNVVLWYKSDEIQL